jgi:hypothetical protein
MQVSRKLRTASTVMAWLSFTGAAVIAIAVPLAFLVPNPLVTLGPGARIGATVDEVTAAIPLIWRAAAMAIALVPIGLAIWALISLFQLFRFYAAGRVFETPALSCLKRVSTLLFMYVLADIPCSMLKSYVLHAAAGQFWFAYNITGIEFVYLFLAGVVLVIARVMGEAQRLADENAKFV